MNKLILIFKLVETTKIDFSYYNHRVNFIVRSRHILPHYNKDFYYNVGELVCE